MPSRRLYAPTAQTGGCRPTFGAASPASPPLTSTSWPPTTMPTFSSPASDKRGGSRTRWGGLRPLSSEPCPSHISQPRAGHHHQVNTPCPSPDWASMPKPRPSDASVVLAAEPCGLENFLCCCCHMFFKGPYLQFRLPGNNNTFIYNSRP